MSANSSWSQSKRMRRFWSAGRAGYSTTSQGREKREWSGALLPRPDRSAGPIASICNAALRPRNGEQDCVARDVLPCRRSEDGAGHQVEAGAAPGAGDCRLLDFALGERPASVRAGIGEGVDRASNIEERDLLAGELDEGGLPGWEVNEVGDLGGLGHGERSFGCKDSGLPRWLAAKPRPSDGYQRPPPPPPPRP